MDLPAIEPTLGFVVETDRGSLPFALIHGESLVACAAWALGDAGVDLVDLTASWAGLAAAGEAVVLHDVLCPMTPASFIVDCVLRSEETGAVVVGVRPVTDTVKGTVGAGLVGATVDRDGLWQVTSPIVLPPAGVEAFAGGLSTADFAALVSQLALAGLEVVTLEAPAEGRRVASLDDVRLLEALTARALSPAGPPRSPRPRGR